MPKKTPEEIREEAVRLRKAKKSYTFIQRELGITAPTLVKILREAGLTVKGGGNRAPAVGTTSPPQSVGTPTVASPRISVQSLPVAAGGVGEFMPEKQEKPRKNTAQEAGEFACDSCGSEFSFDAGDELPDACPECGQ